MCVCVCVRVFLYADGLKSINRLIDLIRDDTGKIYSRSVGAFDSSVWYTRRSSVQTAGCRSRRLDWLTNNIRCCDIVLCGPCLRCFIVIGCSYNSDKVINRFESFRIDLRGTFGLQYGLQYRLPYVRCVIRSISFDWYSLNGSVSNVQSREGIARQWRHAMA